MLDHSVLSSLLRPFNVDPSSATFIRYSQNFAYACTRAGQRVVMRVARDRLNTRSQVEAELHWNLFLAESGIDVCRPLPSREGRLVETSEEGGSKYAVVCLTHVPGRKILEADRTLPLHAAMGRMAARLHDATLTYAREHPAVDRPAWHASRYYTTDLDAIASPGLERFCERLRDLVARVRSLPIPPDQQGLVHADISFGNCYVDESANTSRLWLFDFDNCEYAPFVHDFTTMLYDAIFCTLLNRVSGRELTKQVRRRWDAFLGGYAEIRPLPIIDAEEMRQRLVLREGLIYAHYLRVLSDERKQKAHYGLEQMRQNVEDGVTDVPL